jgi:CRP/FNR family transcriptional regulator, dissimilatory nitrate respiration regulator
VGKIFSGKEKAMKFLSQIATIPLFSGLDEPQLQELAMIVIDQMFRRGQTIFLEGDEGSGFYVVITGKVKIYKMAPDGKEQILHIFGPGEPFAEVPVFAGQRFPANAEALEESRLFFFPRASIVELIRQHPSLALNMLAVLSRRLRQLAGLVEDLSLKEVPARLAAYLLYQSDHGAGTPEFELEIAKGQLASLLGTIPETLSRILAKLVKEGLIQSSGPRITVVNKKGLQELAAGVRRL